MERNPHNYLIHFGFAGLDEWEGICNFELAYKKDEMYAQSTTSRLNNNKNSASAIYWKLLHSIECLASTLE